MVRLADQVVLTNGKVKCKAWGNDPSKVKPAYDAENEADQNLQPYHDDIWCNKSRISISPLVERGSLLNSSPCCQCTKTKCDAPNKTGRNYIIFCHRLKLEVR